MHVRRRNGVWLIGTIAVCAVIAVLNSPTHNQVHQPPGSQTPGNPLSIYGVRPGDSRAHVVALYGPGQTTEPFTWHYRAMTVRFASPSGPVQAVLGTQLKQQRTLPYSAEGRSQLSCIGDATPLSVMESLFNPRTDIQPPTADHPFSWVVYPRFHVRVELFPHHPYPSAYYTLADEDLLWSIQWSMQDIPEMDTRDASGMTGQNYNASPYVVVGGDQTE